MRCLVLADMDDLRWRGGRHEVDAVLACGDVADAAIVGAAEACGGVPALAVKGNHDRHIEFVAPIRDVHRRVERLGELTVGGFQGCWQYKPRGHYLYSQEEVAAALERFPPVDIFLAHNSPRGVHDRDDLVHIGFDAFAAYIARARPRLFLHGHQHVNRETQVGATRVVGVYGHRTVELE
ncbi:MAG: metallophosphoesterase family protein [Planctomycetota bacterium]